MLAVQHAYAIYSNKREEVSMISPVTVQKQLKAIGASFTFFGKPEIDELPKIMVDGEVIQHIIFGRYEGGYATLCATNFRILLVDKKILFLTVEDVRYDMIAELDYGHQFIGATIHIRSFSKDLKFQCYNKEKLRDFTNFVQQRVMELRQHHLQPQLSDQYTPQATPEPMPIPMQTFNEPDGELTPGQVVSVLPLNREKWHKANPRPKAMNPYVQSPLLTRKRIGRYGTS